MNEVTTEDMQKNVGLVFRMAQNCSNYLADPCLEFGDLLSWGTLGLHHSLKHFDPSKGFQFSSYACVCIRGYILQGLRRFRPEKWRAMARGDSISVISLTTLEGASFSRGIGRGTTDPWRKADGRIHNQQLLNQVWPHVSARQREVVELVLYSGMSQTEVAAHLGVSRALVSLMWRRTIRKAQEIFEVDVTQKAA